jgi:hypothetical protein
LQQDALNFSSEYLEPADKKYIELSFGGDTD